MRMVLPLMLNLAVPSPWIGSFVLSPRVAVQPEHGWYEMKALYLGNMLFVAQDPSQHSLPFGS